MSDPGLEYQPNKDAKRHQRDERNNTAQGDIEAYASPSLAARASGARVWHINAAYPAWLDYNLEGKPGEIGRELYTPSAVRSSDHDPLVVGLR
ncbi:MAG: hypothetical protein AAGE01_02460 [Pseudomonadota bacterium]